MSDLKIIQKALKKAERNGYIHILENEQFGSFFQDMWDDAIIEHGYYRFIFSNDFAKAFWGEDDRYCLWGGGKLKKDRCYSHIGDDYLPCEDAIVWKYHLMQMVLEENPLKYIERFLSE